MSENVFIAYWADEHLDGLFGSRPSYSSKREAWVNAIEFIETDEQLRLHDWHDKTATTETKIRRMKKHGIGVGLFECKLRSHSESIYDENTLNVKPAGRMIRTDYEGSACFR